MIGQAQKRFWADATVVTCNDGFSVELDGRSVKTPAKVLLAVPTLALAEAIASEWQAQDDVIRPESMPVTRAANAAIDKVSAQFDEVAELIAAYGQNDLLCYRADSPEALIKRQAQAWDPLLDWAAQALDARLNVGTGVLPIDQPKSAIKALDDAVFSLTPFELTALHDLVSLSGSLVIGLASIRGHQNTDQLWEISRIDEDWQIEQWGVDEEAAELTETKRVSFKNAQFFYEWCQY